MSNFDALLLAHLIGDFLLQSNWMAVNKQNQWLPLLLHSIIYTLSIWIISYIVFAGLSWTGLVLVFGSHLLLDKRSFVNWWSENIMGLKGLEGGWLRIVADQIFHLLLLAVALYM